jgi:chromosome segregation ATPase
VRGKKDVERELAIAEALVESLREQLRAVQDDKLELKSQISKLQDALISVRAPAAYMDQQDEKYEAKKPKLSPEALERNRVFKEFTEGYLNGMEGPLLRTPEDMDDLLVSGIISEVKPPTSLHGNSES